MATEIDFYKLLEVRRDCDGATLKSSYRKLAMKYHPDRNPRRCEMPKRGSRRLSAAYEVLKDPQKRAAYDRYGHEAFQQGMVAAAAAVAGRKAILAILAIFSRPFLAAPLVAAAGGRDPCAARRRFAL